MDTNVILNALSIGEEKDWEFKAAHKNLPGSIWATLSAMANTDGGIIVLGIAQRNDQFSIEGVLDPQRLKQDFWNLCNNREKISVNLFTNDDVTIEEIDSKSIIVIRVPRAT